MLVLTRKRGQRITIGDVVITITRTSRSFAKIGIDAPDHVRILRDDAKESMAQNVLRTAFDAKAGGK
jgi:carbon storage regulator